MTYQQAGEVLRQRRDALKLSMRAAAALGGVSPQAWSDMEAGKHPPSLKTQRAVSKALRWPLDWVDRLPELATLTPLDDGAGSPELADRVAALERKVSGLLRLAERSVGVSEVATAILSPADPNEQAGQL